PVAMCSTRLWYGISTPCFFIMACTAEASGGRKPLTSLFRSGNSSGTSRSMARSALMAGSIAAGGMGLLIARSCSRCAPQTPPAAPPPKPRAAPFPPGAGEEPGQRADISPVPPFDQRPGGAQGAPAPLPPERAGAGVALGERPLPVTAALVRHPGPGHDG